MPVEAAFKSTTKIDLSLLAVVLIFLYLMLFRLPATPIFTEFDPLIFLYNADRMLGGEVMYRDFVQFTFPGGQVLYYFLFCFFGPNYWLLGAATIVMGACSFWLCLKVSRIVIQGPLAYLPSLVFVFFGMRWFGLDGSHRTFSPLFVLLAILALLKGRGYVSLVAAGIFCAFASFFTQPRGIVAVAALLVFVVIDSIAAEREWTATLGRIATLSASFGVSLVLLCSYYILSVGLDTFFQSTIVYPALYYRFHEHNGYGAFFAGLNLAFEAPGPGGKFLIIPTVFYSFFVPLSILLFPLIYWRDRTKRPWEFWRRPALIAIVAAFLVLTTTAPNSFRFFNISAPCLILLTWAASYLKVVASRQKAVAVVLAVLLVVFGYAQAFRTQFLWPYTLIEMPRGRVAMPESAVMHKYVWLLENTFPGEYVYEVGVPYIYFPLGLKNPTRYGHIVPTDYTRPEQVEEVVADLKRKTPRLIVWQNSLHNGTTRPG